MTTFVNAWVTDNAPWHHLTPKFYAILSGGLEDSGENLGHRLLQELLLKISLCQKSLYE